MKTLTRYMSLVAILIFLLQGSRLDAAGGTTSVASKGNSAYVQPSWPNGVEQLVNDPLRTEGWNDWFSDWPSDVNHYAFRIENIDDLNRLIRKLVAIEVDLRQIRLSVLKEPQGLG